MLQKLATRVGVVAATTAMAALALSGSAQAQPGAGYIGYGYGNSPAAVKCVQRGLNMIISDHYADDHALISVDSAFGPETDEAIRYVQYRSLGAAQSDGVVGPKTGDLLMRYLAGWYYGECYPVLPTSG